MERAWLVLALVAVCVLAGYGLYRGWRHRADRQAGIGELPGVPDTVGPDLAAPVTGIYVSTTTAGNWQDRIVARGLGRRAKATVGLTGDGVLIDRVGEEPIFIPAADLSAAGTAPGIAGKVMGLPAGLLVITWRLDGMAVDSGIRADDPQVQASWIDAANELIGGPWSPTQPPVKPDGTAPGSNGAPA